MDRNTPSADAGPLLKATDVARTLNLELQTLADWRCSAEKRRALPFVKVGSAVRYRQSDVSRFIEANLQCA